MDEKPLHVQVAEALGWTNVREEKSDPAWFGTAPPDCTVWGALALLYHREGTPVSYSIPRYDLEWRATGPLVDRYNITLGRFASWFMSGTCYAVLPTYTEDESARLAGLSLERTGPTRLIATCNLILAMKELGKL